MSKPLALLSNLPIAAVTALVALWGTDSYAHGISEESRETMTAGGVVDYIWLGAEHMVTGYDHLLFLFGVIFFLTSFRDIVRFITAFTLGHCITLLGATLAGITANAYLIDAVIALSVIYKGFENLDGFKKVFKFDAPNLLTMVFIFGLIHGFGLSTRLQELPLGDEGLISRILAFNIGVELGQVLALTVMLGFFKAWRSTKAFARFDAAANTALIVAGVGLLGLQIDGYLHEDDHHTSQEAAHEHGTDADHHHAEDTHDHDASVQSTEAGATPKSTIEPSKAKKSASGSTGDKGHTHGAGKPHRHGSGKPHTHGPKKKKKRKTHSHGSGKPHHH